MSDCKRRAPSIETMEHAFSTVTKKRKTTASSYNSSPRNFPDLTVSPEASVNSAGTVVSAEFCSDYSPLSCCSSSCLVQTGEVVKKLDTTPLDPELQANGFETLNSTYHNFKSFSLLSEFSGDSEESTMFPAVKMPPKEEIDEFFAMAEKYEQKRFAEKYNFDIVTDMPLEGRYQWVRLH